MDVMEFLEPITYENIHELQPGEWIWDNSLVKRRPHNRSIGDETITEPIGFRQVHILDLKLYPHYIGKQFMLSEVAGFISGGYEWVYFSKNRFYRFKRKEN